MADERRRAGAPPLLPCAHFIKKPQIEGFAGIQSRRKQHRKAAVNPCSETSKSRPLSGTMRSCTLGDESGLRWNHQMLLFASPGLFLTDSLGLIPSYPLWCSVKQTTCPLLLHWYESIVGKVFDFHFIFVSTCFFSVYSLPRNNNNSSYFHFFYAL